MSSKQIESEKTMQQVKKPSQNAIGRALGLSSSNMTKLKKQGCPMDSIESVRAWRLERQNIAQRKPEPLSLKATSTGSHQAVRARAIMCTVGEMLEGGQDPEAVRQTLKEALSAVPKGERDSIGLNLAVMRWLLADALRFVQALDSGATQVDDVSPTPSDMTDAEAQDAGEFLYEVASGEFVLNLDGVHQAVN